MKSFLLRVITGMVVAALFSFYPNSSVNAALITKTLDANTRITPPGIIMATQGEIPMFKKGTVVTLDEYGNVLEGILADTINLPYESGTAAATLRKTSVAPPMMFIPYYVTDTKPKYRLLTFKEGNKVIFNAKGEVTRGTITNTNDSIEFNSVNHMQITSGEISFHDSGMVATCTLGKNTYLRPVGWQQLLTANFTNNTACSGLVEFKGKQPLELNEKGEVMKGTLNNKTQLLAAADGSSTKLYEAGTIVEFDEKGVVIKAEMMPKPE
ncbi:hypothetical protein [Anaerospora sp.]|uniref:hypothetical protein n=1 Tax=Anaerospora sp. TaxID=1960278 RepID=UPI002899F9F2|nr:hypothetical protein [Anaerospora sp.]